MCFEILVISEEDLKDVIDVITNGLKVTNVSKDTKSNLKRWCREEIKYLSKLERNR